MMYRVRFEYRDELMNIVWEEGMVREVYFEGRIYTLSMEGGGVSRIEKMVEE